MIAGTIVLEDHILNFISNAVSGQTTYTISDMHENKEETLVVATEDFSNALSIAMHIDGLSAIVTDDMQESAENAIGEIRWIP